MVSARLDTRTPFCPAGVDVTYSVVLPQASQNSLLVIQSQNPQVGKQFSNWFTGQLEAEGEKAWVHIATWDSLSTLCFMMVNGHALQGALCSVPGPWLWELDLARLLEGSCPAVGGQPSNVCFLLMQATPMSAPQSRPSAVVSAAQAARYATHASSYQKEAHSWLKADSLLLHVFWGVVLSSLISKVCILVL